MDTHAKQCASCRRYLDPEWFPFSHVTNELQQTCYHCKKGRDRTAAWAYPSKSAKPAKVATRRRRRRKIKACAKRYYKSLPPLARLGRGLKLVGIAANGGPR